MNKYERRRLNTQILIDGECNGKQSAFAKRADLPENYVSRMLYPAGKKGKKNIGEDVAEKIEKRFNRERGWLDNDPAINAGDLAPAHIDARKGADALMIQQYDVAGAMGSGGLVLDEQPPGLITGWRVDKQWLRMNVPAHTSPDNLCIVTGFGSSMQPMYNSGDPLLMDRGVTDCKSDGIYFFRIGDYGWIKQLQRIPTSSGVIVRAKSMNPSYDPFEITEDMDFHVLGKILMAWRGEKV